MTADSINNAWAEQTPQQLRAAETFSRDVLHDPDSARVFAIRGQIAMLTKSPEKRLQAGSCTHRYALLIDGPGEEQLYACDLCVLQWNTLDGPLP